MSFVSRHSESRKQLQAQAQATVTQQIAQINQELRSDKMKAFSGEFTQTMAQRAELFGSTLVQEVCTEETFEELLEQARD